MLMAQLSQAPKYLRQYSCHLHQKQVLGLMKHKLKVMEIINRKLKKNEKNLLRKLFLFLSKFIERPAVLVSLPMPQVLQQNDQSHYG